MDLFEIMLGQMGVIATILFVGFLSVKIGLVSSQDVTSFSRVLLGIFIPILILTLVSSSGTKEELLSMGPYFIAVCLMFFILIGVAFISAKIFGIKPPLRNVHVCSSSFVNSALLGYPIVIAVFPQESGLAIATFVIAETFMLWTVGVSILTYGEGGKKFDPKKFVTPMTICLTIAIAMIFLEIKPKGVIWKTLCEIGDVQKYIGLLYVGMDIGRRGLQPMLKNPKVFLISPIKLIIGPLVVFFILRALNIVDYNYVVIITIFSMLPTMLIITILAHDHNCFPEYASAALLSTTILSLVTMPFVFYIITSVF